MAIHVALLRGINVGGKNRLPMAALVELVHAAGARDVSTYIQSGNVVFTATDAVAKRMPAALSAAIAKHHALTVPVITRRASELAAILGANPYPAAAEQLHVVFLASTPSAAHLATLDPRRSPPDEFVARGRELYLRCPNGIGNSKLTNAYFDARLATTSTVRNWKTVAALAALAAG